MANQDERTFFQRYKWYIIGIGAILLFRFIGSSDSTSGDAVTNYTESEEVVLTEGVVTKLDEVQDEVYKITDEEVVPTIEESRIIANNLDGSVDTFTLEEVAMVDTTLVSEDKGYRRRSGISRVVTYGVIGYMLGRRPVGTPVRRSSYASTSSYNKSTAGSSRVASSATRRTVRTPVKRTGTKSSGYGSGKSSRSYGG